MKKPQATFVPASDEKQPLFVAYLVNDVPRIEIFSVPGPEIDPGEMGIVFADAVRTYASMYRDLFHLDESEARRRIREVILAELDMPSASMSFSDERGKQ